MGHDACTAPPALDRSSAPRSDCGGPTGRSAATAALVVRCRRAALCRRLVLVLPWATVVERSARSDGLAVLGVSSTNASPCRGRAGGADVTHHLSAASGGHLSSRYARVGCLHLRSIAPGGRRNEATWLKRRKSVNALLMLMVLFIWLLMSHHGLFVQPP